MKTTTGQPDDCFCSLATPANTDCNTPGCSNGTNRDCNNGNFDDGNHNGVLYFIIDYELYLDLSGCNCPFSPSNVTHNGYDNLGLGYNGFNYINCTGFGGDAPRDSGGRVRARANAATDCCNFCCNRTDLHPFPTTATTRVGN